jgi:O-antigen/teichoic acid export membrane protein
MTAASLLNALSLQIPFLLIPILFDLSSAGQYFLAHRVLVLPASLVAAAVNQVFFGEAAFRRDDAERLRSLARNAAISLLIFAIPTYTIVLVAGPPLIRSVFGSEWDLAGTFAQISAPWLILWSVANPISGLLLVGRRERESLAFTAAELAVKTGALLAGAALHSLIAGIVILSIASVAINFAGVWRFLRVARVGIGELFRPAARIVAICLVPVGAVAVVAVAAPAALLVVSGLAWLVAIGLCVRFSPEPRALQATSRD